MIHPQLQTQFDQLRQLLADAVLRDLDSSAWVEIPNMELPTGWNMPRSTIAFQVPNGYPQAKPDCFYADANLRLATGALPVNSNVQNTPAGSPMLWFSWHVNNWRPNEDSLLTWMRVVERRLRDLR